MSRVQVPTRGHRAGRSSGAGRTLRSLTASGGLVVRRRARRDASLLVASAALVALSALLTTAGPGLVLRTVDGGAQDAVRSAGELAVVELITPVGTGAAGTGGRAPQVEDFLAYADELPENLPPGIAAVTGRISVAVVGSELRLLSRDDVVDSSTDEDGVTRVQPVVLTDRSEQGLALVDGAWPQEPASTPEAVVEVVVSAEAAAAAGLTVGTDLVLVNDQGLESLPAADLVDLVGPTLRVTGTVATTDPGSAGWTGAAALWEPLHREPTSDRPAFTRIGVLTTPAGADLVAAGTARPLAATARLHPEPASFTTGLAAQVVEELEGLRARSTSLSGDASLAVSVRTGLGEALEAFPAQARAALAQMSVMISGVIGVAGVVLVLTSRLLVNRRAAALALERARGASVGSVALRLGAESLVVTAVGAAAGVGAGWLLVGPPQDPKPLAVVLVIAVAAAPVQGAWLVRRAWTGRREPANRRDRAALSKRRRVRRLVAELAVVALAAAAVTSLRGRGLLQDQTRGIDPFLAVAPLLLVLAVTVLLLRAYPYPVRAFGVVGRRTPGVLGLLSAVRAQRAIAPLPLLALTLGVALAVSGGLLVGTVRGGQEAASWDRVGADVRITAEQGLSAPDAELLRSQPGVDAVALGSRSGRVTVQLGTTTEQFTVVAVDDGFPAVAAATGSPEGLEALAAHRDTGLAADGVVPVVVDERFADLVVGDDQAMYLGPDLVRVTVVGSSSFAPEGYLDGPYLWVDRDTLGARLGEPPPADIGWVVGPGAERAADLVEGAQVTARAQWLEARRDLALIAGVEQMMVLAVAAIAVLATVALVTTVLGGARERGRALSMLRTLGMTPRTGWWLALAELAPVVGAAVVGGVVSALLVVVVLAPALGLDVLSGGLDVPDPAIEPDVIVALAGGVVVLLLLAVMAEVLAHRRDRLSDVLRVGETV